ncbi:MAG: hypothetical protein ACYDB8_10270 [Acidiferrobacterales bacterium]
MKRPWWVLVSAALSVLPMAGPSVWPQGDALASTWNRHEEHGSWPKGRHAVVFPYSRALPDSRLTPGALNPAVTQATLRETICRRGGYTRSVRPAERYTEALKRAQIRKYGYRDHRLGDYEEDHLISLELGGSPDSPRNLWPEPHHVVGGWGSYAKDRLENRLHWMVCHRRITLSRAQYLIAHDWIAAYRRYLGPVPYAHRRHDHRVYR